MRGDPLDITLLYSFAEFTWVSMRMCTRPTTHGSGHHLHFGRTKGKSVPITRGYPLAILLLCGCTHLQNLHGVSMRMHGVG